MSFCTKLSGRSMKHWKQASHSQCCKQAHMRYAPICSIFIPERSPVTNDGSRRTGRKTEKQRGRKRAWAVRSRKTGTAANLPLCPDPALLCRGNRRPGTIRPDAIHPGATRVAATTATRESRRQDENPDQDQSLDRGPGTAAVLPVRQVWRNRFLPFMLSLLMVHYVYIICLAVQ